MPFVTQNSFSIVLVPQGQKIIIGSFGAGQTIISYSTLPSTKPEQYYETARLSNASATYGTFPADRIVRIDAGNAYQIEYVVGANPSLTNTLFNPNQVFNIVLGGTLVPLTAPIYTGVNSINNFTQHALQNTSNGGSASADMIAYPDNVINDTTGFADMGIACSGFSDPAYAVTVANDAYFFGSAPSGAGKQGNLIIATDSTGSRNDIKFATNGFNSVGNFRLKIKKEGQITLLPMASDPANPEKGDLYFNSTSNKLKVYTGSVWETITSA